MAAKILLKKHADFLVAYCLAALIACLPIILFVPRYIDDYGRGISGYFRWAEAGFRPLADWLYWVFNLGAPATAVAPLGQLVSIPVSAIGALAISRAFQIKSPLLAVVATLPIFFNPYFLENLSYGFDSLSMTAGLTLAVLAASLMRPAGPGWRRWVVMSACLLGSLFLYQPVFGAYLPLALTLWLWQTSERSSHPASSSRGVESFFALVSAPAASLIVFALCKKLFWLEPSRYGLSSSALQSPSELVQGMGGSLSMYLQALWGYWHDTLFLPIALLLAVAFVVVLTARLSLCLTRTQSVLIAAVTPALLLCIAPGPMYFLADIDFPASPRMNAYIGGLFASLALPVASFAAGGAGKNGAKIFKVACVAMIAIWAWCQIVFSYAYGHAMQAQREYEQGRLTRLMYDISLLDVHRQARFIRFEGAMPASPLLVNTIRKFPLMDRLVPRIVNGPRELAGPWPWSSKQLSWHGFQLLSANRSPPSPADVMRAQECRNSSTSRCSSEHNVVLAGERLIVKMK